MRLLGSILPLLAIRHIVSGAAAAAAAEGDDKFAKLQQLSTKSKSGVLQLTNTLYDDITTAPRNYTAVLLLTALDSKFSCALCKEVQPEYELLSRNWQAQHRKGDGLIFGMLDFAKGRETFMKVCFFSHLLSSFFFGLTISTKLGLNTAPILYLFPPTVGPHANPLHVSKPIEFEFSQMYEPAARGWILLAILLTKSPQPYPSRSLRSLDFEPFSQ